MFKTLCAFAFFAVFAKAQESTETNSGTDFESDFFQGMENGFFLRDDLTAYKEYECPDLIVNEGAF